MDTKLIVVHGLITIFYLIGVNCNGISFKSIKRYEELPSKEKDVRAEDARCSFLPTIPLNTKRYCTLGRCKLLCVPGHRFADGTTEKHLYCIGSEWITADKDKIANLECKAECKPECQNGGVCISPNTCRCPHNYRGPNCQYSIENCNTNKLKFNGIYHCNGDRHSLRCMLSCPKQSNFEFKPESEYVCKYEEGTFQPTPIPQCNLDSSSDTKIPSKKEFYKRRYTRQITITEQESIGFHLSKTLLSSEPILKHFESSLPINIKNRTLSSGLCVAWNGLHIKTFDNAVVNFEWKNQYTLVEIKDFIVTLEKSFKDSPIIRFGPKSQLYEVKLNEDENIIVTQNKKVIHTPTNLKYFEIQQLGRWIIIYIKEYNMWIKWNRQRLVMIEVNTDYWEHTAGLCGNNDGNPANDFILRNRQAAEDISNWVTDWSLEEDLNNEIYDIEVNDDSAYKHCESLLTAPDVQKGTHDNVSPYLFTCMIDYIYFSSGISNTLDVIYQLNKYSKIESSSRWGQNLKYRSECPNNMIYKTCATFKSEKLCGIPSFSKEFTDQSGCFNGCYCKPGFFLRGDKCVAETACPCYKNGQLHSPGTILQNGCNLCSCTNGGWTCSDDGCKKKRCTISGNSHIMTFDGNKYDFMGICEYYLMKTNDFSIATTTQQCDNIYSCAKKVTIRYGEDLIEMSRKLEIYSNGVKVILPFETENILVQQISSDLVKATIKSQGVEITWNGITETTIELLPQFSSSTLGLCGTNNDNLEDDFTTPNGKIVESPNEFGNKWAVNNVCSTSVDSPPHPCTTASRQQNKAKKQCDIITSNIFKACHPIISPNSYYENCIFDMCAGQTKISTVLCNSISMYAKACAAKGIFVNWRQHSLDCAPSCSEDQEYSMCTNSCFRTCGDLNSNSTCTPSCIEGCACPQGQVFNDNNECVPTEKCSCQHNNKVLPAGTEISKDKRNCICQYGSWQCHDNNIKSLESESSCLYKGAMYKSLEMWKDHCKNCRCSNGEVICDDINCRQKRNEFGSYKENESKGKTCLAWGDQHYEGFSGHKYNFTSSCSYILSEGQLGDLSYQITTKNVPCKATQLTCSKEINVKLIKGEEEFLTLRHNNQNIRNTRFATIRKSGLFNIFEATDFGISIKWDGEFRVYLQLDPKWSNSAQGLCGDFYNPTDAFEKYQYPDNCVESHENVQQRCSNKQINEVTQSRCDVMKSELFQRCHAVVSYESYYQDCLVDTCDCHGRECDCLCTSLSVYADKCSQNGVPIRWRSQDLCPIQCDERCSKYTPCMSTCPIETCDNYLEKMDIDLFCKKETCVEGCLPEPCPEGQIYSNSSYLQCISKEQCKPVCLEIGNEIFYEGDIIHEDNCSVCHCKNGKKVWQGEPCTSQAPTTSSSDNGCSEGWSSWVPQQQYLAAGKNQAGDICSYNNRQNIQCRHSQTHQPSPHGCTIEGGANCGNQLCDEYEVQVDCACEQPSPLYTCPDGMVYDNEGLACNNMCSYYKSIVQQYGYCQSNAPYEAYCVSRSEKTKCLPGERQIDEHNCVAIENCPCVSSNGRLVKPGETVFVSDCESCHCKNNELHCTDKCKSTETTTVAYPTIIDSNQIFYTPTEVMEAIENNGPFTSGIITAPALVKPVMPPSGENDTKVCECRITPHASYLTYDGASVQTTLPCSYIATQSEYDESNNVGQFQVKVKNGVCNQKPCIEEISIRYRTKSDLDQEINIIRDDEWKSLTFKKNGQTLHNWNELDVPWLSVEKNHHLYTYRIDNSPVKIQISSLDLETAIVVPKTSYGAHIEGICGNCDDNPEDEIKNKDGLRPWEYGHCNLPLSTQLPDSVPESWKTNNQSSDFTVFSPLSPITDSPSILPSNLLSISPSNIPYSPSMSPSVSPSTLPPISPAMSPSALPSISPAMSSSISQSNTPSTSSSVSLSILPSNLPQSISPQALLPSTSPPVSSFILPSMSTNQPQLCYNLKSLTKDYYTQHTITASSEKDKNHSPKYCTFSEGNSWQPKMDNKQQFIQINFKKITPIYGIVTAGDNNCHVSKFNVFYSKNSKRFHMLKTINGSPIFEAYSTQETEHLFQKELNAKVIKINPISWSNCISLKLDVLGCDDNPIKPCQCEGHPNGTYTTTDGQFLTNTEACSYIVAQSAPAQDQKFKMIAENNYDEAKGLYTKNLQIVYEDGIYHDELLIEYFNGITVDRVKSTAKKINYEHQNDKLVIEIKDVQFNAVISQNLHFIIELPPSDSEFQGICAACGQNSEKLDQKWKTGTCSSPISERPLYHKETTPSTTSETTVTCSSTTSHVCNHGNENIAVTRPQTTPNPRPMMTNFAYRPETTHQPIITNFAYRPETTHQPIITNFANRPGTTPQPIMNNFAQRPETTHQPAMTNFAYRPETTPQPIMTTTTTTTADSSKKPELECDTTSTALPKCNTKHSVVTSSSTFVNTTPGSYTSSVYVSPDATTRLTTKPTYITTRTTPSPMFNSNTSSITTPTIPSRVNTFTPTIPASIPAQINTKPQSCKTSLTTSPATCKMETTSSQPTIGISKTPATTEYSSHLPTVTKTKTSATPTTSPSTATTKATTTRTKPTRPTISASSDLSFATGKHVIPPETCTTYSSTSATCSTKAASTSDKTTKAIDMSTTPTRQTTISNTARPTITNAGTKNTGNSIEKIATDARPSFTADTEKPSSFTGIPAGTSKAPKICTTSSPTSPETCKPTSEATTESTTSPAGTTSIFLKHITTSMPKLTSDIGTSYPTTVSPSSDFSICEVSQKTSYLTYDKAYIPKTEDCYYVASKGVTMDELGSKFEVLVYNTHCSTNRNGICLEHIIIKHQHAIYEQEKQSKISVDKHNGFQFDVMGNVALEPWIQVDQENNYIKIQLIDISVEIVIYYPTLELTIEIPNSFFDNLSGLCGNSNGKPNDDATTIPSIRKYRFGDCSTASNPLFTPSPATFATSPTTSASSILPFTNTPGIAEQTKNLVTDNYSNRPQTYPESLFTTPTAASGLPTSWGTRPTGTATTTTPTMTAKTFDSLSTNSRPTTTATTSKHISTRPSTNGTSARPVSTRPADLGGSSTPISTKHTASGTSSRPIFTRPTGTTSSTGSISTRPTTTGTSSRPISTRPTGTTSSMGSISTRPTTTGTSSRPISTRPTGTTSSSGPISTWSSTIGTSSRPISTRPTGTTSSSGPISTWANTTGTSSRPISTRPTTTGTSSRPIFTRPTGTTSSTGLISTRPTTTGTSVRPISTRPNGTTSSSGPISTWPSTTGTSSRPISTRPTGTTSSSGPISTWPSTTGTSSRPISTRPTGTTSSSGPISTWPSTTGTSSRPISTRPTGTTSSSGPISTRPTSTTSSTGSISTRPTTTGTSSRPISTRPTGTTSSSGPISTWPSTTGTSSRPISTRPTGTTLSSGLISTWPSTTGTSSRPISTRPTGSTSSSRPISTRPPGTTSSTGSISTRPTTTGTNSRPILTRPTGTTSSTGPISTRPTTTGTHSRPMSTRPTSMLTTTHNLSNTIQPDSQRSTSHYATPTGRDLEIETQPTRYGTTPTMTQKTLSTPSSTQQSEFSTFNDRLNTLKSDTILYPAIECYGFLNSSFISFDDAFLPKTGPCTFVASQSQKLAYWKDRYQVFATYLPCTNSNNEELCIHRLRIVFETSDNIEEQIGITTDNVKFAVTFMNRTSNNPYELKSWITFEEIVLHDGEALRITLLQPLVEIIVFSPSLEFIIKVSKPNMYGKLEGLCGDGNMDKYNDVTTTNGAVQWRLESEKAECGELGLVKPTPACQDELTGMHPCDQIFNLFKECGIDMEEIYTQCKIDVCANGVQTSCAWMEVLAQQCSAEGTCIEWRNEICPPPSCPLGQIYKTCPSTCTHTCEDVIKNNYTQSCNHRNLTAGCYCPEGKVLKNGVCISSLKCSPCDEEWKEDKCTECKYDGEILKCIRQVCPEPPVCGLGSVLEIIPANDDQCCDIQKCVPASKNCSAVPQSIHCPADQYQKTITLSDGCPMTVCECRAAKECPPLEPPRDLPEGFTIELDVSGCCPKYKTRCNPSNCRRAPDCGPFGNLVHSLPIGACCPIFKCIQQSNQCTYVLHNSTGSEGENGSLITKNIGDNWQDGPCNTCECHITDNGPRVICAKTVCSAIEDWPDHIDYVLEPQYIPGKCCPIYKRTKCKYLGKIYDKGTSWFSSSANICTKYSCVQGENNDVKKIEDELKCPESCLEGFILTEPDLTIGECCTSCKPNACIYNGALYDIGTEWHSVDFCTSFKCVMTNVSLQIESHTLSCPEPSAEYLANFVVVKEQTPNNCCPNYKTVACKVGNKQIQAGEIGSYDLCTNILCVNNPNGMWQKKEMVQNCNSTCPLGSKYKPSKTECCGTCVQKGCVVDNQLRQPSQSWTSTDTCTIHTCELVDNEYVVVSSHISCPDITDCSPDQIYLDGCCQRCKSDFADRNCTLKTLPPYKTIGIVSFNDSTHGSCRNTAPINNYTICDGNCKREPEYHSQNDVLQIIPSKCSCCSAAQIVTIKGVELGCEDGYKYTHSVSVPSQCRCKTCIT